jgi:hypothetical protein
MYRDYANYKNHGEVIFSNAENLSLDEVEKQLRSMLKDDTWFYVSKWGLKDLHFEKYDDEIDHAFHEFESLELTNEEPTEQNSIKSFLAGIKFSS